jgi:hypothetical protein
MPYLSVRTATPLTAAQIDTLQKELGELISVIPGKNIDNCMIDLTGGCNLFMGGKPLNGAFADLRLMGPAPDDTKDTFVNKFCALLDKHLGIPDKNIYVNLLEQNQWGSSGKLAKLAK